MFERIGRLVRRRDDGARRGRQRATTARAGGPRSGEYTPPLWPIAVPAVVWLVVTGVLGVWMYRFMLGRPFHPVPWPVASPRVGADVALKNTAGIGALVGAVLTGVYAYRKQKLAEGESRRADAQEFSRRYGEALTQLGGDQPAVRLGGAYAMARLADDWEEQRQTCIDVLCAYLRMRYDSGDGPVPPGENEVRSTIQRIIETHVARRPDGLGPSWSPYDFDLTGAHLHNVRFLDASFCGDVWFEGTTFSGTAWFDGATFTGHSGFEGATFTGTARFARATFSRYACFTEVTFSGIASFGSATFSDTAWFANTSFSDAAWFESAVFREEARFEEAAFSGNTRFTRASFWEGAWFIGTTFLQDARFTEATFSGKAGFTEATFCGGVWFDGVTFSGEVGFTGAVGFTEVVFPEAVGFTGAVFHREPVVAGMVVERAPELSSTSFLDWPEPVRARRASAPGNGDP